VSWFRRSPKKNDPETLWKELEQARLAGDRRKLSRLIHDNANDLDGYFATWQRMPEALRADARERRRYGETLLAIAQEAAAQGNERPLQALVSPQVNERLTAFVDAVRHGQRLVEKGSYREGIDLLESALASFDLSSPEVTRYRAVARGAAGIGYSRLGEFEAGERELRAALALSIEGDDAEGVRTYQGALDTLGQLRSDAAPDRGIRVDDARTAVAAAQELADLGARSASDEAVRKVLADLEGISDARARARDELRSKCHAILAGNSHDAGEFDVAREQYGLAIAFARAAGDQAAVSVYALNLRELDATN
jgi:tetratricopeptide (TPR) repeat protein